MSENKIENESMSEKERINVRMLMGVRVGEWVKRGKIESGKVGGE